MLIYEANTKFIILIICLIQYLINNAVKSIKGSFLAAKGMHKKKILLKDASQNRSML